MHKLRPNFTRKLVLSITSLSIIGLIIVYIVVNTTFRTIIYDNVVGVTYSNVRVIAHEVDNWFELAHGIVENLSRLWVGLGMGYIEPVAKMFLDEYDFLSEVITGFDDGSVITGTGWVPDEDWIATMRPWYIEAETARGELVTTVPHQSAIVGPGLVTFICKWVPDLDGFEAVVGIIIELEHIIEMVNEHRLADGGYLILIGPNGEVISHPQLELVLNSGRNVYLQDIPNGEFLRENISQHVHGEIPEFDDHILGPSYLMSFGLSATGWTLAAVLPIAAVMTPVSNYLVVIMMVSGAVVVALLLLTMFFMTVLTRDMEESRVTEERLRIIIDNMPLVSNFRDRDFRIVECNEAAARLFELSSKEEYMQKFFDLSPEFQPDGRSSTEKAQYYINMAFETGYVKFEWLHCKLDGTPVPTEVSLTRVNWRGEENIIAFVSDLRALYKYKETEQIARQRLQAMLDSSPLLVTIFNEDSEAVETNQEAERLFEIRDKQEYVDDYFAFSPEFQPNGIPSRTYAVDVLKEAMAKGYSKFEWTYKTSSGEPIPCEETIMSINLAGEKLLIAYTRDLRDFYKYKETERIAQQRLQAMLNSSPLACSIIDENFNILEVNDAGVALFNLGDANEYIEKFFELSPKYQPDGRLSREKMYEKLRISLSSGRANFEWMHQTLGGETQIPCELTLERLTMDGRDLVIAYIRDLREINKVVEMVQQLEKAAFTDPLTGARNRRYLLDEAEKQLRECVEKGMDYSLIMVDVDHFKVINDTYGHPVGDEVLKILVGRMIHAVKRESLVARYGGEEFIVSLPKTSVSNAMGMAERLRKTIEATKFVTADYELEVTISLGVASKSDGGISLLELIGNADKALYHAKNSGRNRVVEF
ncbi:MAG: diguanylate cyclase [Oscillospiraceae bacterium]|nr:diguanylate cyclase [Oscillospiraceae bacterium]